MSRAPSADSAASALVPRLAAEQRAPVARLGRAIGFVGTAALLIGLAALVRDALPFARRAPALLARWAAAPSAIGADLVALANHALTPDALLSVMFQGVTAFVIGVGVTLRRAGRAFRRVADHARPEVAPLSDALAGLGRVFSTLAGFMVTLFVVVLVVVLFSSQSLSTGLLERILQ